MTTVARPIGASAESDVGTVDRPFWFAVFFDFLAFGVGVGFGWDRRWHATHPFEDFFSAPQLFEPTRRRVLGFAILAGLCPPAFTGALDLYLRARTP